MEGGKFLKGVEGSGIEHRGCPRILTYADIINFRRVQSSFLQGCLLLKFNRRSEEINEMILP